MIYQTTVAEDVIAILHHIDNFAKGLGISQLDIDTSALEYVCYSIRRNFPCVNGIANASVFKKVANFVAHFIEVKPIQTILTKDIVGETLAKMDLNAIIAFDIALVVLKGAKIYPDSGPVTISNDIYLSNHSYTDILDALSSCGDGAISSPTHFKLLSVFFEQLVYKTNPKIQYQGTEVPDVYPKVYSVTDGDSMMGN